GCAGADGIIIVFPGWQVFFQVTRHFPGNPENIRTPRTGPATANLQRRRASTISDPILRASRRAA
ncbi:hypothetical protein, partial [Burkholderia cenocepacia]|uniref:hypothetical protein n=1 Tax=Burkholderia cenocepacia TaxID=95486 RepID=UPI001E430064